MRLAEEKAVDLRSETKPTGAAGQANEIAKRKITGNRSTQSPQGKKASNQTTTEAQNASLGQRGAIRSKGQLHNGLRCFFSVSKTGYKAQGNG